MEAVAITLIDLIWAKLELNDALLPEDWSEPQRRSVVNQHILSLFFYKIDLQSFCMFATKEMPAPQNSGRIYLYLMAH